MKKKRIIAKTVITTHMNADLDGISSMMALHRLYPDAILVRPDTCEPAVTRLLEHPLLMMPHMPLWKDIDLKSIQTIFLVDANEPERVGPVYRDLKKRDIQWIIYYTHPAPPSASITIHTGKTCATTSFLLPILKKKGIQITNIEATILALGIYEDTGFFTFPGTTPGDLESASYLLKKGADIRIIHDILQIFLEERQEKALTELRKKLEELPIHGYSIHFASIRSLKYIPDLALVVHRLMDLEPIAVLFVAHEIPGHVYVIARSRSQFIDVGEILSEFDGGGHAYAGSASLKGMTLNEFRQRLINILQYKLPKIPGARDIMASPVRVISKYVHIETALEMMNHLKINALPVTDGKEICGLVHRQILDIAVSKGLGKKSVETVMERRPPLVSPDTPIEELLSVLANQASRILLVGEDYAHVEGVLTRFQLLHASYDILGLSPVRLRRVTTRQHNYWRRIQNMLQEEDVEMLKRAGDIAEEHRMNAYLVGGPVRDIVMGIKPKDIDIVVEGNAILLAQKLSEKTGGRLHAYEKYGTATLITPSDKRIDFATARTEVYPEPGKPPQVEVGTALRQDLYRRDFTINALALALNPGSRGVLKDYFGGLHDIQEGVIRVLHSLSFIEDPTRMLRACRFAGRYGFKLSPETEVLLKKAQKAHVLKESSLPRIGVELKYTFQEPQAYNIIALFAEFRLFQELIPQWRFTKRHVHQLYEFSEALIWYRHVCERELENLWVFWVLVLMKTLPKHTRTSYAQKWNWNLSLIDELRTYLDTLHSFIRWFEKKKKTLTKGEIMDRVRDWPWYRTLMLSCIAPSPLKNIIKEYLQKRQFEKPLITGHDLQKLGIPPGPRYKDILRQCWIEQMNRTFVTKEEALLWVQKYVSYDSS